MSDDHEETRPQKRSRTAEDSSPSRSSTPGTPSAVNILKRHDELWFDDGSVILVARNTGFRVYRALLARQSTVFADMFSSSTPKAEEMFEGCPVIHVSDSAEDVAHFLRVLLPTSQRTLFSRSFSFSFHQISAVIRLAHKYDIQDVLDQAIASLQDYFTSDFSTWECKNKPVVRIMLKHSIGVVNLAKLVDRPLLLPLAFYGCALLGSTVLDGYKREDMSVEQLLPEDLKCCIRGRNQLAANTNVVVSEVFIADPCERCTTRDSCQDALRSMLEWAVACEDSARPNVLSSWQAAIKEWVKEVSLCVLCEQAAIDRDTVARKQIWDALPDTFGIKVEGWVTSGGDGDDAAAAAT